MNRARSILLAMSALAIVAAGCVPPSPTRTSSTTTVAAYSPSAQPVRPSAPAVYLDPAEMLPDLDDPTTPVAVTDGAQSQAVTTEPPPSEPEVIAIDFHLPAPVFRGTPVPANEPFVEKPRGGPRPPFLAPAGTMNLALQQPVISSDLAPLEGDLDLIVDGDKEATGYGCLTLHSETQWVQIDLGSPATLFAVVLWHNHAEGRVYRDVVVQVSDDPDFLTGEMVFNNDYDNSSGLGIGSDLGYVETSEGKLIECLGITGRYVRLHSRGNHLDAKNHYTEVEVYGLR